MHLRIGARLACVALLSAAMSCGGSTEPLAPCSGPVELAVSPGTSPIITWTPACGATVLYVDPQPPSLGETHERWLLMAGDHMLEPRIRYGQVPAGTTERAPAIPLVAGQPYTLILDGTTGRLAFKIVTP